MMIDFISSLPEEITSYLISLIDSKRSLSNLSLCSKLFQRITLPYLYSHVELHDLDGKWEEGRKTQIRSLTSLFLRKPEYAFLVRRLTMRTEFLNQSNPDSSSYSETLEAVEVEEVLKTTVKTLSHSDEEEKAWLEHASWKYHDDALFAIMLPSLIRLEILDILLADSLTYLTRTLTRIVYREKPFDTEPALTVLNTVMQNSGLSIDQTPLTALFSRLPAIKAIYASGVDSSGEYPIPKKLGDLQSTATHIELKDCKLDSEDLQFILQTNKDLRTFIYEIGRDRDYADDPTFTTMGLQKALQPLETSLEKLWVDYGQTWLADDQTFHWHDVIESMSFVAFKTLKFLRVASAFLFGDPEFGGHGYDLDRPLECTFPPQLETLELSHCEYNTANLIRAITNLLKRKKQGIELVLLNKIILEGAICEWETRYCAEKDDLLSALVYLLTIAEDANVNITLLDNRRDAGDSETHERLWGIGRNVRWAACRRDSNRIPLYTIVDLKHKLQLS